MTRDEAISAAWSKLSVMRLLESTYEFASIPSPTGEEAAFSALYAEYLRDLGLEVSIDAEWPSSPSVIAWWRGKRPGGRVLQFDGHTDTIPTPHATPSLDRDAQVVRGRGTADMKGGLAAIVEAIKAVRAADIALEGSILVTAHGLHEAPLGDQRTLRSLIARGVVGDAAIVAELGEASLPLAAKGMAIFRITVSRSGEPMHEAEATATVAHPLRALTRLLVLLEEQRNALQEVDIPLLGPESLFLGEVHGGDFYNRVPTTATVVGTRRWATPRTVADIQGEFDALCARVAAETGSSVTCTLQEVGRPFTLSATEPLVQCVRRAYRRATDRALPLIGLNVVGNAADLVGYAHIPAVYHGVNQSTAHSDNEFVVGVDLRRAAQVYAATIIDYLGCSDTKGGALIHA